MISDERIMGFVEGEGCFSIMIQRYIDRKPRKTRKKNKIKNPSIFRVMPTFRITIAEKDRKILDAIKERLGIGGVYVQKREIANPNMKNICHYHADSFKDLRKIKEFFGGMEFYTSKENDFLLWCKCLEIVENKQHLTREGLLEICRLRDQMNSRKNKTKRTSEIIQRILEQNPEHIAAHVDKNQSKLLHNNSIDMKRWLEKRRGKSKAILEEVGSQ